uniref:Uncharacterized protein n=1 Tax=Candidatus Kentrum sp. LFY TaxID=2126342 RepID=A0A450V040_9GAMM|nr:MAG: hypothetical protein BECKLFY1418B_GA0070995_111410 [Candidatus Kentron sp. LFY]
MDAKIRRKLPTNFSEEPEIQGCKVHDSPTGIVLPDMASFHPCREPLSAGFSVILSRKACAMFRMPEPFLRRFRSTNSPLRAMRQGAGVAYPHFESPQLKQVMQPSISTTALV